MKKTLVALAVLAAAGASFAQSSVTMYGVADGAIAKKTNQKWGGIASNTMNNGNSRLGVRGTEDLGGGLKASFNFEQAIDIGNGATNANTWDRNAYMAISGGFGEVFGGRRLSPNFYGIASYELTGAANYSALANQFTYGGPARNNSMVGYTTPTIAGFTATVATVLAGNSVGGNEKYAMNVIYATGPIVAALTYDKNANAERNVSLGGSYNFGVAKVAVSLQDPAGVKKGFTVGASAPVGPVTLAIDVARDTGSATKSTDVVLEAKYALSKRTFAYAAALRDGMDSAAANKATTNFGVGVRHNF